jgi:hypothetical protein
MVPPPQSDKPSESSEERLDRQFGEFLQELRVAVTGVQVLFAFLLTLPFQSGFSKIGSADRWLFLVALLSAAFASICFITPAAQHRLLFGMRLKQTMLQRANDIGVLGTVALVAAMTSSVSLVVKVVIGGVPAVLLTTVVALTSTWLWFVRPIIDLRHQTDLRDGRGS